MVEDKIEMTTENIDIQDELNVDKKIATTKRKKSPLNEKECDVLVYNALKKTMIISFDGFGYEFKDVKEYPGKKVIVKYSGKIDSPNFKLSLK